MQTTPTKRSQNKRNQQTNQQQTHQEAATTSSPSLEKLLKMIEKLAQLEGKLVVTKNVNKLLSQEVDDLEQYERRVCVILDGITPSQHETTEEITKKAKNVKAIFFRGIS